MCLDAAVVRAMTVRRAAPVDGFCQVLPDEDKVDSWPCLMRVREEGGGAWGETELEVVISEHGNEG